MDADWRQPVAMHVDVAYDNYIGGVGTSIGKLDDEEAHNSRQNTEQ